MITFGTFVVGWVAGIWTMLALMPSHRTPYDFNSLADEFRSHAKETQSHD